MTTPFVAFRTPSVAPSTRPESLALGLCAGALAGAVLPAASLIAELTAGGGVAAFSSSPGALVTLLAPCVAGAVGAWLLPLVHAHRSAYDQVAQKAGTLLDETWELRGELDRIGGAPALPQRASHSLEPDEAWLDDPLADDPTEEVVAPVRRREASEEEQLIEAQAQLLHSIGSATRDTSRRMQVSLRGLGFTPLTAVQERLVQALNGHLDGLRDLADEVVAYAEEAPEPPQQDQGGRARAVA